MKPLFSSAEEGEQEVDQCICGYSLSEGQAYEFSGMQFLVVSKLPEG